MSHSPPLCIIDVLIDTPELLESDEAQIVSNMYNDIIPELALPEWKEIELSVTLTDDAHIQPLNAEYRKKNAPTNVLSFATHVPPQANSEGYIHLGDIIVSIETLKKESEHLHIPYEHHFKHLIIHGLLHVLGYDHEKEEDATIMESKEIALLERYNIPSPYAGTV